MLCDICLSEAHHKVCLFCLCEECAYTNQLNKVTELCTSCLGDRQENQLSDEILAMLATQYS